MRVMPVTLEEMLKPNPMHEAMEAEGITPKKLAKKLAEELDAYENKVFYDKDRGKCHVGPRMVNWKTRQAARMDAQKLLGLYPAEKVDVEARVAVTPTVTDEERALLKEVARELARRKLTES
jgi:hypothetical protein